MIIPIKNYEFRIYFSRVEKRTGICSQNFEQSDKHCLLWDFDEASLCDIFASLSYLRFKYGLPQIIIIESSPQKYHAYCFASRSFREVINILSATPQIDMEYLKLGIIRGFYTLRISKRDNWEFKVVQIVRSGIPNEMSPLDLTVIEYLTSNRGQHNVKT